jgi:RNA binding exosome subunit
LLAVFLDESGIFETAKEHAQLNTGLVYKGENPEQAAKKLQTLLEQICFQHKLTYPEGLHGSKIKNLKLRRQIQNQIRQFLVRLITTPGN